jgi:tryptophanyl-tRNA synthetase
MTDDVILTGIKPTGAPHLGNYLGAIQPAMAMASGHPNNKKLFFIADYHALTTMKDPENMRAYRQCVAATWLAFFEGVDHAYFYFQSQIPQIFELYWILSCFCPKGLLNRAHAYKTVVAHNVDQGHDPDRQVNHGVFSYPVLMAADILLFQATQIPIGPDQKQHVEIAIEIVTHLNRYLNYPIPIPAPLMNHVSEVIIGIDGQKMSKNYNNTLPVFASSSELKKRIAKIKTTSTPLGTPLDWVNCHVFKLFSYISDTAEQDDLKSQYASGNMGYGHAKAHLGQAYEAYFKSAQSVFNHLMSHPSLIQDRLSADAKKVSSMAEKNLMSIKQALGF